MTFTGHPDWLPTPARQSAALNAIGTANLGPNSLFVVPLVSAGRGDVLRVLASNATFVTLDINEFVNLSTFQQRVAGGTGGTTPKIELVADVPVTGNADVRLYNNTGVARVATYYVDWWLNTTPHRLLVPRPDYVNTVATVGAGLTADVAFPNAAGLWDRIAGNVVSDQAWTAVIRWSDLNAAAPTAALRTWDEQVAAGAANVPGAFDVPVRAPMAVLRVSNGGAVLANVFVTTRLVRVGG